MGLRRFIEFSRPSSAERWHQRMSFYQTRHQNTMGSVIERSIATCQLSAVEVFSSGEPVTTLAEEV